MPEVVEYARLRGLVVADNYRLTDVLIYRFNDFMSSLRHIKPLIIKWLNIKSSF